MSERGISADLAIRLRLAQTRYQRYRQDAGTIKQQVQEFDQFDRSPGTAADRFSAGLRQRLPVVERGAEDAERELAVLARQVLAGGTWR